ncbi:hypothetical protein ACRALDRAFT_208794 [Sodiomyces alcalophilus JCM 7366]|uniref:uncharacterized protein n=1 Tax=Sodiomyces alcalophilus JCM 7366 TaxID=591952 RepID=UPI0039B6C904
MSFLRFIDPAKPEIPLSSFLWCRYMYTYSGWHYVRDIHLAWFYSVLHFRGIEYFHFDVLSVIPLLLLPSWTFPQTTGLQDRQKRSRHRYPSQPWPPGSRFTPAYCLIPMANCRERKSQFRLQRLNAGLSYPESHHRHLACHAMPCTTPFCPPSWNPHAALLPLPSCPVQRRDASSFLSFFWKKKNCETTCERCTFSLLTSNHRMLDGFLSFPLPPGLPHPPATMQPEASAYCATASRAIIPPNTLATKVNRTQSAKLLPFHPKTPR